MARGELSYPPAGVETTPTSHDVIPLRTAARRLGKDHRTVRAAIIQGRIRGGAEPHPQRCRWYVYADELPAGDRVAPAESPRSDADQRAEVAALKEALSVLLASQAEIVAAVDDYQAAADGYRVAGEKFQSAADGFRGALSKHRDALAQLVTPGHVGDLDQLL
ncbi:MAG: hypothetical protein K2Y33_12365 [Mycolicibacterium frederiksbergense]|nr:hypothetical protein [Mycolicibacterium frederiksbergense]